MIIKEGSLMEMRHVKTFCAIVKYGNFSKSRARARLCAIYCYSTYESFRERFTYPSFRSVREKVLLTKAGHQFHPYALELLSIYEKAQEIPKIQII